LNVVHGRTMTYKCKLASRKQEDGGKKKVPRALQAIVASEERNGAAAHRRGKKG